MLVGLRVDQLDIYPDAARIRRDAALQRISDAEFRADLPDSDGPAFVGKGGGARNDEAAQDVGR